MCPEDSSRLQWIDFLKGIGLIMVLAGHFVEPYRETIPAVKSLFVGIYSFHMPLFCILSGFVTKKDRLNIIGIAWIYFIARIMYLLVILIPVQNMQINGSRFFDILIKPFFHLWYLYALVIWRFSICIVNLLETYVPRGVFLIGSIVACLLSGYVVLSKDYGLMRVVAFYPFYLFGYFWKDEIYRFAHMEKIGSRVYLMLFTLIILGMVMMSPHINVKMFFNNQSYIEGDYFWYDRFLFLILGCFLSLALIGGGTALQKMTNGLLENKNITMLGERSLYIYIFHGFLFQIVRVSGLYQEIIKCGLTTALFVLASIVLMCLMLFSNRTIVKCLDIVFMQPIVLFRKLIHSRGKEN